MNDQDVQVLGKDQKKVSDQLTQADIEEIASLKNIATPPPAAEANHSVSNIESLNTEKKEIDKLHSEIKELPTEEKKGTIPNARKQKKTVNKKIFPNETVELKTDVLMKRFDMLEKKLETLLQQQISTYSPLELPQSSSLSEKPTNHSIKVHAPTVSNNQFDVGTSVDSARVYQEIQHRSDTVGGYGWGDKILDELQNLNKVLRQRTPEKDIPFDAAVVQDAYGKIKKRKAKSEPSVIVDEENIWW